MDVNFSCTDPSFANDAARKFTPLAGDYGNLW